MIIDCHGHFTTAPKELQAFRDEDPVLARAFDIAQRLEGLTRHASTHAAGIVIGDRPLRELVLELVDDYVRNEIEPPASLITFGPGSPQELPPEKTVFASAISSAPWLLKTPRRAALCSKLIVPALVTEPLLLSV